MTTSHREADIKRFDQWAKTYEQSRLQGILFDQAHQAALACERSRNYFLPWL